MPLTVCLTPAGRRLRLFHFLFEMLQDPSMAHCLSWVPAAAGVFCFSSRNKDQVAALWGERKGNKRPMTYQKMSRALRNYARSGHIFKVKKKLTYQFSRDTLTSLQKVHTFVTSGLDYCDSLLSRRHADPKCCSKSSDET
uniref:Transcription factor Spi-C n=1 Tax=Fundulus heteroclitus TaxID=8078 RepID=A0A3Q2Q6C6_FUNHE